MKGEVTCTMAYGRIVKGFDATGIQEMVEQAHTSFETTEIN